jgi:hypothetical protein
MDVIKAQITVFLNRCSLPKPLVGPGLGRFISETPLTDTATKYLVLPYSHSDAHGKVENFPTIDIMVFSYVAHVPAPYRMPMILWGTNILGTSRLPSISALSITFRAYSTL